MSSLFLLSALAIFLYMNVVFILALLKKDNSLADIAWGPGFVVVALLCLFAGGFFGPRQVMVTVLVSIWGWRLALYIFFRHRGRGEDFRYAKWRRGWGRFFLLRSYGQIFLLQGFFLFVIALPVILVNGSRQRSLSWLDGAGLGLWLLGFVFEAGGDWQLSRFKKNPENRGKIMTGGLWKYTRHPNYFGEAAMWWGVFLIALSVENGWLAAVSPLTITFLLLKVSGVAMLEKKYAGNPEFAQYAARTSAFFPWPPKKPKIS